MAIWTVASWGISPVGSLWAGALAAKVGAQEVTALGALVCLVYALATWVFSGALRDL
jgi:hypothetical protein